MNVSIAKELERYIAEQVETGRFADASAVVSDALRLHEAHLAHLRDEVGAGIDDFNAGRHRIVTAGEFLNGAKARASAR